MSGLFSTERSRPPLRARVAPTSAYGFRAGAAMVTQKRNAGQHARTCLPHGGLTYGAALAALGHRTATTRVDKGMRASACRRGTVEDLRAPSCRKLSARVPLRMSPGEAGCIRYPPDVCGAWVGGSFSAQRSTKFLCRRNFRAAQDAPTPAFQCGPQSSTLRRQL